MEAVRKNQIEDKKGGMGGEGGMYTKGTLCTKREGESERIAIV